MLLRERIRQIAIGQRSKILQRVLSYRAGVYRLQGASEDGSESWSFMAKATLLERR